MNDSTSSGAMGQTRDAVCCPMHPQIRQDKAGSCPICGMALEPEGIPEAEGTSPELEAMTRRFVIGAVLATPIVVLEMGDRVFALHVDHYVSMVASIGIQCALATPIVAWCAWPFFHRAWTSVLKSGGSGSSDRILSGISGKIC